jgi:YcaO-like protein with predicted kinase domain
MNETIELSRPAPVPVFGRDFSQKKGYMRGTHRVNSPAETVGKYSPLMPRLGITRLANVTGLDCIGLPVYVAIRPNSRALATAQGKGLDADSAKASALMESIEGWHGEHIDAPLRYVSYPDLRRRAAVADVTQVSRRAGAVLRLDGALLWIEGWDLLTAAPMWVPYEAVTTDFVPGSAVASPFLASTNGLASGNHLLEAIAHGLCEVIERDAVALWSLAKGEQKKERQLDLATVDDPSCTKTLELLAQAGVFVAAWDITSDSGIPAYSCTILEGGEQPRWRAMGAFSGHGCHPAPGVALMRALSEAVQSRLTVISGSRDDVFPRDYASHSNEDDHRRMLAAYSIPAPRRSFKERSSLAAETFEEDVSTLLAALRRMGVTSAVVVDLSKPDIDVPVVKVVVPGLESFLTSVYSPGARASALLSGRPS